MSDGPEFLEIKIEAADIRRKTMLSALVFGAVLPGMAEVLPELAERRVAGAPFAGQTGTRAETLTDGPVATGDRWIIRNGVVVEAGAGDRNALVAFARLFERGAV